MNDPNKWVYFSKDHARCTVLTFCWDVQSIKSDEHLGVVRYYNKWRKYVFETLPSVTIFDDNCLSEIWAFVRLENEKRKEIRKREK